MTGSLLILYIIISVFNLLFGLSGGKKCRYKAKGAIHKVHAHDVLLTDIYKNAAVDLITVVT